MTDDRVEELAKDLLRLVVNHGLHNEPEEAAQDCARLARALFKELEKPTPRKTPKVVAVERETEEEEDFDLL